MNFLKKVAKDLQRPSRRRQSAPVLETEALRDRSVEYHQALNDFNERRRNPASHSPFVINKIREECENPFLPMAGQSGNSSGGEKSSPTYADIDETGGDGRSSPPAGFFRMNSIPVLAASPRKSSTLPANKGLVVRNHGKGPAPPPPIPPIRFNPNAPLPKINNKSTTMPKGCFPMTNGGMETDGSQVSGTYRRFDLSSSNYEDDFPAREKQQIKTKKFAKKNGIRSPIKTTNGGNFPRKYHRRQRSVGSGIPPVPASAPPPKPARNTDFINGQYVYYDQVIDEDFKFLQGCGVDSTVDGSLAGAHVPVTDLDASDEHLDKKENPPAGVKQQQQILESSVFDPFYTRFQGIVKTQDMILCWPDEISARHPAPGITLRTPLSFSSGQFRGTLVSLRQYTTGEGKNEEYAEIAIVKDYEVLKEIRHPDISLLMAVNLISGMNQMNLVMESFDFSLNHFLYRTDFDLSMMEISQIVQQVASAVYFLHKSNIVHSNVSSHAIMMRRESSSRYSVKLTGFELSTSTEHNKIEEKLVQMYGRQGYYSRYDGFAGTGLAPPDKPKSVDKEKMLKLSTESVMKKIEPTVRANLKSVEREYMSYLQAYRQHFSLHYYLAPELVKAKANFVFPRRESDVYSVSVLLWEMVNRCVPLIMYSYEEVEAIHGNSSAREFLSILTIQPDQCQVFQDVFSLGLEPEVDKRISMHSLLSYLEEAQIQIEKKGTNLKLEENPPMYPDLNGINRKTGKVLEQELPPVEDFDRHFVGMFDNCTTYKYQDFEKANSCVDEFPELERNTSQQRTNGELSNVLSFTSLGKSHGSKITDNTTRKRMSILLSHVYDDKPNDPLFNLSQSTIFPSTSDFHNKLLETAKEGDRLERTSTTKKKKQRDFQRASDIFPPVKSRVNLDNKLASEGEGAADADDSKASGVVEKAKARLRKCILNGSRNCSSEGELEEKPALPAATDQQEKKFSPSKYTFNVGSCDSTKPSIAKKNKMRRNAWLAEKKTTTISPNGSSFNFLSSDNSAGSSSLFREGVMFPQNFKLASHLDKEPNLQQRSNSFRKMNLKVKHNNQEIFSSENSIAGSEDLDTSISKKVNQIHLDLFKEQGPLAGAVNPKIEVKVIGHRDGESREIRREILDLSAQIVEHFDKRQLDQTTEKSTYENDSRKMIIRPEQLDAELRKQKKTKAAREDVQRFQTSLWHRERSICEKTSCNGSLADDTVDTEDLENCISLANRRINGDEAPKIQTEDIYMDDDLSLLPTLSVNIDLELP